MNYRDVYAIGDIHGEMQQLTDLLEYLDRVGIDYKQDLLVFLGDYIDRGPDSCSVILQIRDLIAVAPDNVVALYGNHEQMMWNSLRHPVPSERTKWWMNWTTEWDGANGGQQTLNSYKDNDGTLFAEQLDNDLNWIHSLPRFFEYDKWFFSHAPIPAHIKDLELAKATEDVLIWSYPHPQLYEQEYHYPLNVRDRVGVCGHVHNIPKSKHLPRFYGFYVFTDTGCGCDKRSDLVAVNLTKEIFHTSKGQTYDFLYNSI